MNEISQHRVGQCQELCGHALLFSLNIMEISSKAKFARRFRMFTFPYAYFKSMPAAGTVKNGMNYFLTGWIGDQCSIFPVRSKVSMKEDYWLVRKTRCNIPFEQQYLTQSAWFAMQWVRCSSIAEEEI